MLEERQDFNAIMQRLYEATETKTQQQLATILEVQQSSISDSKRRESIPDSWLITLLTKKNINPLWVLDGTEPKFQSNDNETPLFLASNASSQNPPSSLQEVRSIPTSPCLRFPIYSFYYSGQLDEENNKIFDIEDYFYLSKPFYKEDTQIFRLDNKSMEPSIMQNSLIFVDSIDKRLTNGEIYLFCLPGEGMNVSRIFTKSQMKDSTERILELVPENKLFPPSTLLYSEANDYVIGRIYSIFNIL